MSAEWTRNGPATEATGPNEGVDLQSGQRTDCDWWWRVKDTGKPSSFDEAAAREAACKADDNSPKSFFFAAPEKERFAS